MNNIYMNKETKLNLWSLNMEGIFPLLFPDYKNGIKAKAIPLQAWTGPEGTRRLRFPDFKTIGTWRW